jgi:hypothetical protein
MHTLLGLEGVLSALPYSPGGQLAPRAHHHQQQQQQQQHPFNDFGT